MPNILNRLQSEDYTIASKALKEYMNHGVLDDADLEIILSLTNKLIVGDFLEENQNFSDGQLQILETYIIQNIDDKNRLFVSDLIAFATDWGLTLPYKRCIEFLEKYDDDNLYVQIASIEYIFENFKTFYFDEIYTTLTNILNNVEVNQSVQVRAAFILYRFTFQQKFLNELTDLVNNGSELNKEVLKNILAVDFNKPKYFGDHDMLATLF